MWCEGLSPSNLSVPVGWSFFSKSFSSLILILFLSRAQRTRKMKRKSADDYKTHDFLEFPGRLTNAAFVRWVSQQ